MNNTNFTTIETLARHIAAERGCDYDLKGAKRAHWRRCANELMENAASDVVKFRMTYPNLRIRVFGWDQWFS